MGYQTLPLLPLTMAGKKWKAMWFKGMVEKHGNQLMFQLLHSASDSLIS